MNPIFHPSFYHAPPACLNGDVPHVHDYHELLYCTAGEGGQVAGNRHLPLRKGDLFFYPAGMRHCSIFSPGRKFDCYVLDFQSQMFTPSLSADGEVLNVLGKMGQFQGPVPISPRTGTAIGRILSGVLKEFREKNPAYHAVLKMMAMQLLITIARDEEFRSQGTSICHSPSHQDMVREVIHYLDSFYMNPVTIESVLEFCPMSRSHFHLVFKKLTGKTLVEYLTDLRLKKAKERLGTTDVSITEIAVQTGFKTSSYFAQVFRASTGLSPREYRSRPPLRHSPEN